jgi:hypothetical protein
MTDMASSEPNQDHFNDHPDLQKLIDDALPTKTILLYDASDRPILKDSDLSPAAEAEARKRIHEVLDEWLVKLPTDKRPASVEELTEYFKKASQSDPRHTLDIVDGKLSLPLSLTVGQLKIKGNIPLYRLAAVVFAAWLLHEKGGNTKPASRAANVRSHTFRTWRTIKLGTFKTADGLIQAIKKLAGYPRLFLRNPYVELSLKQIPIASAQSECHLVIVDPTDLGSPMTIGQLYARAKEFGLGLVPAEAALQLVLQCADKPDRDPVGRNYSLNFAMEPIGDSANSRDKCIFCLHHFAPDSHHGHEHRPIITVQGKPSWWHEIQVANGDPAYQCYNFVLWAFARAASN